MRSSSHNFSFSRSKSNSDVFYKYPSLLDGTLYSVHAVSHHELVDMDVTTPHLLHTESEALRALAEQHRRARSRGPPSTCRHPQR